MPKTIPPSINNSNNSSYRGFNPRLSPWGGLMVLIGLFLVMLVVVSLIIPVTSGIGDKRSAILLGNTLQCVLAFIIPQLICARLVFRQPLVRTGYTRFYTWAAFCGMLFVFIIGMPALNQLIDWNNGVHFPKALSDLEQSLRNMEEAAANSTAVILEGTSLGTLISGVLIIGILTGICEEIFFRAGIQRLLSATGMAPWLAISLAAVIFSALHFQFFGFFPRLILGAFFGYLYYMSRSIWLPATAHALNNSLVVIFAWLQNRGSALPGIDTIGVDKTGFPAFAISSAISVIIFLYFLGKPVFRFREKNTEKEGKYYSDSE